MIKIKKLYIDRYFLVERERLCVCVCVCVEDTIMKKGEGEWGGVEKNFL